MDEIKIKPIQQHLNSILPEYSCNIGMRTDDSFAGNQAGVESTSVGGLIHASGILQDASLSSHTPSLLRKVQTPKASPILFPLPKSVGVYNISHIIVHDLATLANLSFFRSLCCRVLGDIL